MIIPTGDYIIEFFYVQDDFLFVAKTKTSATYEEAFLIGQQNRSEEHPHFRILKVMHTSTDKVKERWE